MAALGLRDCLFGSSWSLGILHTLWKREHFVLAAEEEIVVQPDTELLKALLLRLSAMVVVLRTAGVHVLFLLHTVVSSNLFFLHLLGLVVGLGRDQVSDLRMSALEFQAEGLEARLGELVLVVLLLGRLEGFVERDVLLRFLHLSVFSHVLALVRESAAMYLIPRLLLVFLLPLELVLLSGSFSGDPLKVDREWVSPSHEWPRAQVTFRDHVLFLLLAFNGSSSDRLLPLWLRFKNFVFF